MVFIMNREGTIVETVTSPVHQGSNANEILLLAPFAPNNTVTVGFKLPNGILIQPRLTESGTGETMTNLEVNDLFLKVGADEESMSAWYIKINRDLTRYSGELGIQFFIYDGAGDILASSYATVTVQKGVPILDGTTFDTSTATQLQEELNKVYAALTAVKTDVGTLKGNVETLQTDVSTLKTDMSGAKGEITILKDRMEQAETDISVNAADITRLTDSVDQNTTDIADLKGSKLDKTGGTISGDLDVAGNLFVNGKNYDTTVSSLKEQVDFLSTLLFNTIITLTDVEDTYTSRVTAGGLPVVSNTPTTVHKIAGETKASETLFDLSRSAGTAAGMTISCDNNKWTISGTPTSAYTTLKSIALPSWLGGKKITVSQTPEISEGAAGLVYLSVVKEDGLVTLATSIKGKNHTATLESGVAYRLIILNQNTKSFEEETISFMVNLGETALPYSDYYAGLKNASFKGVTSTGRNLLDESLLLPLAFSTTKIIEKQIAFTISAGTYTVSNIVEGGKILSNVLGIYLIDSSNKVILSCNAAGNSATNCASTFTVTEELAQKTEYLRIHLNPVDAEYNIEHFMLNRGASAFPYEKYITDTSFQLSAAQQLRKWDYIDIDNQRLVTGTAEVTQDTAFTDEQLATYPAGYILSADRKTIAYPLETPTTAALTVPKSYTAWRNGSETVDTGATDALPPTITQTYYEEVTA